MKESNTKHKKYSIKSSRIWEIDLLRGLAVVGMVIFHVLYFLSYQDIIQVPLFEGGWEVFGNFIRLTFFMVVGVGMVLSWQKYNLKKNKKYEYYEKHFLRGVFLLFLGFIISVVSFIFVPHKTVFFGVISFIGASVLLLLPFVSRRWLLGLLSVLIIASDIYFPTTGSETTWWNYVLGIKAYFHIASADYFPLVPWLSVVSLGGFIAHTIFRDGERRYQFPAQNPQILYPFIWIGQRALLIYFAHLPIIIGLVFLFQIIISKN